MLRDKEFHYQRKIKRTNLGDTGGISSESCIYVDIFRVF